jgi:hypothetical protein
MRTETRLMFDLSGVGVAVETHIGAPVAVVWTLVTDLSLTPSVNRETVEAQWVAPAVAPAEGAVFRATNELGDQRWTVDCHVTRCVAPTAFHWTVLDPADPSSCWWYDLEPVGTTATALRHGFRHGPNNSGLRRRVEEDPDNREVIIAARTEMLRANMAFTIEQFRLRAEQYTNVS